MPRCWCAGVLIVPCPLQVPLLTEESAEALPNQCLVRFRGMVRPQWPLRRPPAPPHLLCLTHYPCLCWHGTQVADMLNPEYYVGEFRRPDGTWAIAKYQDVVSCTWVQQQGCWPTDASRQCGCAAQGMAVAGAGRAQAGAHSRVTPVRSCSRPSSPPPNLPMQLDEPLGPAGAGPDSQRLAERKPVLLVPVPGETSWVKAAHAAAAPPAPMPPAPTSAAAVGGGAKRPREDAAQQQQQQEADAMSVSMLVSDATGQTGAADDGDTAATRARTGEVASAPGAGAGGAPGIDDIPAGAVMAYVSRATRHPPPRALLLGALPTRLPPAPSPAGCPPAGSDPGPAPRPLAPDAAV